MYRFPAIAKLDGFRKLTASELQVIILSGEGTQDDEIARQIGIKTKTVSRIWSRVRAKLGLNSRTPAIALVAAAAARVNERLSFEPLIYSGVTSVMGGYFDVVMLVDSKGVILSCSIGMARIFGAWPGLLWSDLRVPGVCLSPELESGLTWQELLEPLDLADPSDPRRMPVYLYTSGRNRKFNLVIRGDTDAILGRVMFLEFGAIAENGAEQAPNAVPF